jgi:hypothetical protein
MKQEQDALEMAHYGLTGEIGLSREETDSGRVCGSLSMFTVPHLCGTRVADEVVYDTVPVHRVVTRATEQKSSFMTAVEGLVSDNIHILHAQVRSGKLVVRLEHAYVTADAAEVLERLSNTQPTSVSYSNVIDYWAPADLHKIARSIAGGDSKVAHYGYTMNWVAHVAGSCILDQQYDSVDLEERLITVDTWTAKLWRRLGYISVFRWPPQTNVINTFDLYSYIVDNVSAGWVDAWFTEALAGGPVTVHTHTARETGTEPLSSGTSTVDLSWRYQQA